MTERQAIKWPEQHKNAHCCHTVIALAAGVSEEEVLSRTHSRLTGACMRVAFLEFGFILELWESKFPLFPGNPFPVDCIIETWVQEKPGDDVGYHIILRLGNIIYDPLYFGKEFRRFPSGQIPIQYAKLLKQEAVG